MRLKEQKLWDTMRRNAPRCLKMERMENAVGSGMPDVFCRFKVGQTWVELKAPIRPKRASTPLMGDKEGLRQSQKNWLMEHHQLGLDAWILIRDDKSAVFLVHCSCADEVNDWTANDLIERNCNFDDWTEIFAVIMGELK